jgi:AAHS family 4-hydroxybenzoate transporter-like MFS transporter
MGLGAAVPSAVALTSEHTPKRLRATFVLAIYCGLSFGFAAAGGAAAWLIPHYGWRALLWAGAVAPLALAVAECAPGLSSGAKCFVWRSFPLFSHSR